MQVHTFIADSANEAVEQIRAELGPAAVVLSVRKLPRNGLDRFLKQEQIEVLAGIEEKTPEPAPIPAIQPDPLAELREEIRKLRQQVSSSKIDAAPVIAAANADSSRFASNDRKAIGIAYLLNQTGMLPAFSEIIAQEMAGMEKAPIAAQIERASELLRRRWSGDFSSNEANVHVYVGVPGCGKSTVLCKMLAQTTLVEGQSATVYQLDANVANASPQPAVYSEIVGAHFERTAPIRFERREESVYVDLPGVPLNNTKALLQLKDVIASFGLPEVHLVLNAAYESSHLLEQVRFFSTLGITDLIVTHLDEETRWGKLWNLVFGTNFSIRSIGCGQNIPGELHQANAELILARQFRGK